MIEFMLNTLIVFGFVCVSSVILILVFTVVYVPIKFLREECRLKRVSEEWEERNATRKG